MATKQVEVCRVTAMRLTYDVIYNGNWWCRNTIDTTTMAKKTGGRPERRNGIKKKEGKEKRR